ncbi:type II toxin-antitoxin system VapC family toxin [Mesorhizobium sp. B2-3-7]|nr:type II toxin-antitoxin system VapC family toxin [Mesorhizobium sp. B3-1-1]TPJ70974.1 type II toxin-antitoxin system VapC family toxin [Mesorhizobium sp. B2-6-7]TPJ85841.1 type II toxin-antitoxin system VapC family toxin [Mesorhizobium sp. B2-6-3]TPJ99709.1 type II toxin-antitoxin system VapC family toxin [Mesorhizobium sp. B2-5-10]TPK07714.1 type II toxin-antitoxin system VapC family toxin [Mesorhizobium sp. B2-5-11]TPK32634.1 type II toxin-antitoxin system VapC family toxin [Mesorhizobium
MRLLLDTNVVSDLRKVASGRAHPNVVLWNTRRMTLVTRNIGDFEGTGVALVNPWDFPN